MNSVSQTWLVPLIMIAAVVSSGRAVAADDTAKKDIVQTAAANKDFSTLVTAVKAADLVEALQGKGPFTVFAPTNDAFKKIPKEQLEALLKDKKGLTSVLTYHVVPGRVMAADVAKLKEAKTLQGKKVSITIKDGKVMINGAQVLKTDIECANGVIHVIDSVIMPPK
jgi:transforming growth factor-beta-induced protein